MSDNKRCQSNKGMINELIYYTLSSVKANSGFLYGDRSIGLTRLFGKAD